MSILNQPPRKVKVLVSGAAQFWSWYFKIKTKFLKKEIFRLSIVYVKKKKKRKHPIYGFLTLLVLQVGRLCHDFLVSFHNKVHNSTERKYLIFFSYINICSVIACFLTGWRCSSSMGSQQVCYMKYIHCSPSRPCNVLKVLYTPVCVGVNVLWNHGHCKHIQYSQVRPWE